MGSELWYRSECLSHRRHQCVCVRHQPRDTWPRRAGNSHTPLYSHLNASWLVRGNVICKTCAVEATGWFSCHHTYSKPPSVCLSWWRTQCCSCASTVWACFTCGTLSMLTESPARNEKISAKTAPRRPNRNAIRYRFTYVWFETFDSAQHTGSQRACCYNT